mmetsp:Transcript_37016/g.105288  ORF Transcript_37016/g.105288 Transcript_37016/m.105288 type:complete len:232 (+) Transcript_37016:548-1243(+)
MGALLEAGERPPDASGATAAACAATAAAALDLAGGPATAAAVRAVGGGRPSAADAGVTALSTVAAAAAAGVPEDRGCDVRRAGVAPSSRCLGPQACAEAAPPAGRHAVWTRGRANAAADGDRSMRCATRRRRRESVMRATQSCVHLQAVHKHRPASTSFCLFGRAGGKARTWTRTARRVHECRRDIAHPASWRIMNQGRRKKRRHSLVKLRRALHVAPPPPLPAPGTCSRH